MPDVTRMLFQIESGDRSAAGRLLPLVYQELRKLAAAKLAQEGPTRTLQATALVHEAFLRLVGQERSPRGDNRGHFFAAAAEAMRRILVENARRKRRHKHGGQYPRMDWDDADLATNLPPDEMLLLNGALDELAARDPLAAKLESCGTSPDCRQIKRPRRLMHRAQLTIGNGLTHAHG